MNVDDPEPTPTVDSGLAGPRRTPSEVESELTLVRQELERLRRRETELLASLLLPDEDRSAPATQGDESPLLQSETGLFVGAAERRLEPRFAFELALPLLAWIRSEDLLVEYHPRNVSSRGIQIRLSLPPHVTLNVTGQIDLCLPFSTDHRPLRIAEIRWVQPSDRCVCGLSLIHAEGNRPHFNFNFSSGRGLTDRLEVHSAEFANLVHSAIAEAIHIKRSLILYLEHLTPLLGRLARLSSSKVAALKRTGLALTEDRIITNIKILHQISAEVSNVKTRAERHEFLARFRRTLLPEIDGFTFREFDRSPETAKYLESIRSAERTLALRYNESVLVGEGFGSAES